MCWLNSTANNTDTFIEFWINEFSLSVTFSILWCVIHWFNMRHIFNASSLSLVLSHLPFIYFYLRDSFTRSPRGGLVDHVPLFATSSRRNPSRTGRCTKYSAGERPFSSMSASIRQVCSQPEVRLQWKLQLQVHNRKSDCAVWVKLFLSHQLFVGLWEWLFPFQLLYDVNTHPVWMCSVHTWGNVCVWVFFLS